MNMQVLSGDRPTGKLHLGHYVGSLTQRVKLQENHLVNILIADTQVLNNNVAKAKDVKENTLELMRAYLAVGLDPEKVNFILQSEILEIFELTNYLSNLVTLPMILRNPTIKAENESYNSTINMGFLNYPISQTSDIILFDAEIVPVGQDQTAILEFGNDLIAKFHHHFNCKIFKHIQPLLSETPKLLGLDGQQKMSKSLDNAIFLSDSTDVIKKKINMMYTDSKHLKVSDPGQVEGNVVFSFLDVFMQDKVQLEDLKTHYRKGGLGDVFLKQLLLKELEAIISPIRDKYYSYDNNQLLEILEAGTQKARIKAKQKMRQVKEVIFK
jgi:tryptophanyl-tRNA synthetase